MTDEVVTTQATETVEGSPVSDSVNIEATDTAPILSVQDYANHRVPVKLDGEELEVPLSEAIAGYQRQADYTRKTQELAQQRQEMEFAAALSTALERDPEATIDLLSKHYGVSRAAAAQMVEDEVDFSELDPTEVRYRELDRRLASFEEQQSQQQVAAEVERLKSKYQDFDVKEVITAALKSGSNDLEGVYKQIAFDKMVHKANVEREAAEKQRQAEEAVVAAKRQAAVVDGGSSATASTTNESFEPIRSVHEAWAAAKRQLNS